MNKDWSEKNKEIQKCVISPATNLQSPFSKYYFTMLQLAVICGNTEAEGNQNS